MLGVEEGRVGDVGILGREARRLGREGRGGVQTAGRGRARLDSAKTVSNPRVVRRNILVLVSRIPFLNFSLCITWLIMIARAEAIPSVLDHDLGMTSTTN